MAKLSTAELLDAFKELTLIELSEFVKEFETTFGVTAAAPVAAAAAPAGAGGGAAPQRHGRGSPAAAEPRPTPHHGPGPRSAGHACRQPGRTRRQSIRPRTVTTPTRPTRRTGPDNAADTAPGDPTGGDDQPGKVNWAVHRSRSGASPGQSQRMVRAPDAPRWRHDGRAAGCRCPGDRADQSWQRRWW